MTNPKRFLPAVFFLTVLAFTACSQQKDTQQAGQAAQPAVNFKTLSTAEWKKRLTPEQYHILREKGTERAFTGKLLDNHEKGTYVCAGCGQALFASDTKFESGTGWPSFYQPIDKKHIAVHRDTSYGMIRQEVLCSRCDGHLGHVFPDGPEPTGLRYCINSISLNFVSEKDTKQ